MKCPNCGETLMMTDRSGIEIDYCPKCRGVWLDKGELDKITERSLQYNENSEGPSFNDEKHSNREYEKRDWHRKKRKGGFLGNLFDFD
ncbi:zf-TFIIB domain-containing protein [Niabella beijingensis]|uniref:TFIIB-type zinc ribbon-containing protein n=1 Tax=Niabella beijingensis TaxID=2872700 RepID=UPI001CC15018|nr:zf-TFIIB domain-containing protein [Niabella beijingensis]MBZ4188918.1 zf-TFIIB domain-containing protein [Niabella beijingensis]